jgi:mRNA interferase MazF
VGLALVCPITTIAKGYPFEVQVPEGIGVSGVVLADQLKSLDWRARGAEYIGKVPSNVMSEIVDRIRVLLEDTAT